MFYNFPLLRITKILLFCIFYSSPFILKKSSTKNFVLLNIFIRRLIKIRIPWCTYIYSRAKLKDMLCPLPFWNYSLDHRITKKIKGWANTIPIVVSIVVVHVAIIIQIHHVISIIHVRRNLISIPYFYIKFYKSLF